MPQMFGAKGKKPFRLRRVGFRGSETSAGMRGGLDFFDNFDHTEPVAQELIFSDTFDDTSFTVGALDFSDGFEE